MLVAWTHLRPVHDPSGESHDWRGRRFPLFPEQSADHRATLKGIKARVALPPDKNTHTHTHSQTLYPARVFQEVAVHKDVIVASRSDISQRNLR